MERKFNQQGNAILNLVPATATQLMMISYFQVGPSWANQEIRNNLKHNDAYNIMGKALEKDYILNTGVNKRLQ